MIGPFLRGGGISNWEETKTGSPLWEWGETLDPEVIRRREFPTSSCRAAVGKGLPASGAGLGSRSRRRVLPRARLPVSVLPWARLPVSVLPRAAGCSFLRMQGCADGSGYCHGGSRGGED